MSPSELWLAPDASSGLARVSVADADGGGRASQIDRRIKRSGPRLSLTSASALAKTSGGSWPEVGLP